MLTTVLTMQRRVMMGKSRDMTSQGLMPASRHTRASGGNGPRIDHGASKNESGLDKTHGLA
jgi:hypothetical protein